MVPSARMMEEVDVVSARTTPGNEVHTSNAGGAGVGVGVGSGVAVGVGVGTEGQIPMVTSRQVV